MHDKLLTVYVKFQNLIHDEQGQDLVEYGLLCTLIALAVISGVSHLASAVEKIFTNISTSIA